MNEQDEAYLIEQAEARLLDYLSGDPVAFLRHLARIRQAADGFFENRAPNGTWYAYLPGGYPYGALEIDALQARGDTITAENVLERYP
jgi:hypothetical protein